MKKKLISHSATIIVVFISFSLSFAEQRSEDSDVPPGMELINIGNARMLAPRGTKVFRRGDLIVPESTEEYLARRLVDIEQQLAKLNTRYEENEKKIEQIADMINNIQEKYKAPNEDSKITQDDLNKVTTGFTSQVDVLAKQINQTQQDYKKDFRDITGEFNNLREDLNRELQYLETIVDGMQDNLLFSK